MNKLVKNTAIYSIGQILPRAAGFILLPIYTRFLTPADYGVVSSMAVLQTILAIFFTLCLDRSVVRLYWDYKTENDKKDFFGTITISIAVLSSVSLFLLFIFNNYVGLIYRSIDFYPFYAYAILSSFIGVFSLVPKNYLMLKEKAGTFIILSLLQFILGAGFILYFITVSKEGAMGYLKGSLFSAIIMLPIFVLISIKICNLKFKYRIFKSAFSFSLPIVPAIMTSWILNLSDRVFIERYFTLGDVGIYSMGYKIAGLVVLFTGSYGLAYGPVFFKLANSNSQTIARKKIFKYNHLYLIVVVFICFIISFFSKEVIILLLDEKYKDAYYFIPLIAFSYLFSQAGGITSNFFHQSKKMKANMYIAISAAIMNIVLNFLLIPPFGPYGAAYATIISMAILWFISYVFCKKHCYFVPINWMKIVPLTVFLIFIFLLFQYILNFDIISSLIIKILLVGGIGLFFMKKYYSQIRAIFVKV